MQFMACVCFCCGITYLVWGFYKAIAITPQMAYVGIEVICKQWCRVLCTELCIVLSSVVRASMTLFSVVSTPASFFFHTCGLIPCVTREKLIVIKGFATSNSIFIQSFMWLLTALSGLLWYYQLFLRSLKVVFPIKKKKVIYFRCS